MTAVNRAKEFPRNVSSWLVSKRLKQSAYTNANELSEGLSQPVPTLADGAAVKLGAGSVLREPVGV